MGDIANNWASWHVRLGPRTTLTVHLKGCDSDKDMVALEELAAAGNLLRKMGNALRRVLGPEETKS
jgi:hypothetical protein